MKEWIYLSGPMSGIEDYNYPAFHAAASRLRSRGYDVFNPAESFDGDQSLAFDLYMRHDLSMLLMNMIDTIAVLPGWEKSPGATLEVAIGAALGMAIVDAHTAERVLETHDGARHRLAAVLGMEPEPVKPTMTTLQKLLRATDDKVWEELWNGTPRDDDMDSPVDPSGSDFGTWPVGPQREGSNEVRITSATGGAKGSKSRRYDLIPAGPLAALAEQYGKGAEKYQDRNWEKGYEWSLNFAAMMRHAWAFWNGEDNDPEFGTPHMTAVAWHAFALLEFTTTHPEYDNRPTTEKS